MNIKCKIGFHPWGGCKCHQCGKTRDKNHLWYNDKGCRCIVCGKIRSERSHGWGRHEWRGCKCIICGEIRDMNHPWHLDCTQCSLCNKKRDEQHDWSKDCEKCSKCEMTRDNRHDWTQNSEKCSVCGKVPEEGNFIDVRDGKEYKWVRFGDQIVMVQNFAYKPDSGVLNGSNNFSGYHYDFETAIKIAPVGWHLPTKAEWLSVMDEFEKYGWKYFDQDTPVHIKSYSIRSSYRDFEGKIFSTDSSYFWSSTESSPDGAVGFCFPRWYGCASGEASSFFKTLNRNLGLSVILFRDK
jgi:uncharacterized protein (TIGR02145 family)